MKNLQKLGLNAFQSLGVNPDSFFGGADETTFSICTKETNEPSDPYACGDETTKSSDDDGNVFHTRTDDLYCI